MILVFGRPLYLLLLGSRHSYGCQSVTRLCQSFTRMAVSPSLVCVSPSLVWLSARHSSVSARHSYGCQLVTRLCQPDTRMAVSPSLVYLSARQLCSDVREMIVTSPLSPSAALRLREVAMVPVRYQRLKTYLG